MLKKAALVTGAVRNSGLGIARKFLAEGVPTFITSRVEEDASKVAEKLTKVDALDHSGDRIEYGEDDVAKIDLT